MRIIFVLFCLLPLALDVCFAADASLFQAAALARPGVEWKTDQVLRADLDCDGRSDTALLGTSGAEIIVLVFRRGLTRKPDSISFPLGRLGRAEARIQLERLDITDKDFREMLGARPDGYRRSRSCRGIELSDGERDPLHLYWYKAHGEFAAWSL